MDRDDLKGMIIGLLALLLIGLAMCMPLYMLVALIRVLWA